MAPCDVETAPSSSGLPRPSAVFMLFLVLAATVLGSVLPAYLGDSASTDPYWLAVPAIIAAVRFGFTGALIASLTSALVTGPLGRWLPAGAAVNRTLWPERALFFFTLGAIVAFLLRRTRAADERAMKMLETQRAQAVAASRERGALTLALERRISRDPLTGLANREAFVGLLQDMLRREQVTAVLFVDLDDFKNVNDTLGHAVGDELIISVARRLAAATRGHDLVARFGGDEFAVLLCELEPASALRVSQRLLAELKTPFSLRGRTVTVRASGGLAVSSESTPIGVEERALELLRQADLAMYASKAERAHGVTLYHDTMQTEMVERLSLESDMHHAIAGHDFFIDYQPIINLRSREVTGVEALMRWQHPTRGLVPPSSFVPVAEQTGMIVPLTLWVVRETCEQMRRWDADPATRGLSVAVNVSGRLVREPGIGSAIAREFHRAMIDPSRLIFEITESLLMEDRSQAIQTLCQLRSLGTRLSVDDFGTGYSSLSRLNKLPIDEVKIDRSFVTQLDTGDAGRTIVAASVAMAHGLGLRVVAEGIETDRQLQTLRALGCDDGQGYLFGRPASPERVTEFCREWPTRGEHTLAGIPRPAVARAAVGDEAITA
ncbi:MAG: EAL domain-containing protein [Frankiales bacterium]|nr:EAL domain-containing protein [Frankiales bacterium]